MIEIIILIIIEIIFFFIGILLIIFGAPINILRTLGKILMILSITFIHFQLFLLKIFNSFSLLITSILLILLGHFINVSAKLNKELGRNKSDFYLRKVLGSVIIISGFLIFVISVITFFL